jgi:Methyltransferase domain
VTEADDFARHYGALVDRRAETDPVSAVGGLWDELGALQIDFLHSRGLRPDHTLLDYGCGCLRGGLHFIRYLDTGNYTGVDISAAILDAGRQFLAEAGLGSKHPTLQRVDDLSFDWFPGRRFDFVFAQSVFTHLPVDAVRTVLTNVPKVLGPASEMYATFFAPGTEVPCADADDADPGDVCFTLDPDDIVSVATASGLEVKMVSSADYPHPRGQRMLRVRRATE